MRKIFQYILIAVAVVVTASCSNDIDETLHPAGNRAIQFVVSDFPAFGESGLTRAIGTQDEGKTAWENGDKILVHLYSQKYEDQAVTLTFENGEWKSDGGTLSYLENETPMITAVYAPDCEIKQDGSIGLLEGKKYGEAEYIPAKTTVDGFNVNISFKGVIRDYSRLRIAGLENQTLTVTTTDFFPAGTTEDATEPYTLTTDKKGNAYLYGTFAEGATITVKKGDVTLKNYTFTAEKNPGGTEPDISYALDARPVIDGTLGSKAEATDAEVEALVQQLKDYVDNGITTIIVTGETPATIEVEGYTISAIGAAIYSLSGSGIEKNSTYLGKIDLILSDVTEIVATEFYTAFALNSITLPKVTKIGDMAFHGCYYLKQLTFGSVLTEVNETGGVMFAQVGKEVDGCNLFINCGQMKENSVPTPDLTTNTWKFKYTNEFKSITLTHTGDCDECKALQ